MESFVQSVSLKNWGLPVDPFFISAGPCSAESREQILLIAKSLALDQISFLRAGAWKPRTLPGSFEGFGEKALDWLVEARELFKIEIGTEVATPHHVEACLRRNIRIVWIGTRTTPSPFAVQELANAMKGTNMCVLIKNPLCPEVKLWIGAKNLLLFTVDLAHLIIVNTDIQHFGNLLRILGSTCRKSL